MKYITVLLLILSFSSLAQTPGGQSLFCDGGKLINENGSIAHHFTFSSECRSALSELRNSFYKLFCDGGDLVALDQGLVLGMNFTLDCQNALMETNNYKGHFCYDGVMLNHYGERLYEFSFQSKCRKALTQLIFEK